MRILMIVSNAFTHDPRVYNEALSLTKAGHEVTVLGWDRNKKNMVEESIDGIEVIRFRNTKFMDLISYDIFRLRYWWSNSYKLALKMHEENPFDIVHCHDLDTLPIGIRLKKNGLHLIYDSHEIWSYVLERDFPQWLADRFMKMDKKLATLADHVITVAEPHEEHFKKMGCKNITLVRNCKRIINQDYVPPENDIFILGYVGGLNDARFLREAVKVCQEMDGIRFRIAGFGMLEEELRKAGESSADGNIEFLGRIPMDSVIPETIRSDVILCMLNPSNRNNCIGPPNKLFEAMVAGRPVIATKGTYSGDLVEELKMGLAIEYDEKDFIDALKKLRDKPALREELGRNALKASQTEYNWEVQERRLRAVYDGIGDRS